MTDQDSGDRRRVTPLEAQQLNPEQATSERAAETPPHADAERLESALREGGPLPDAGADEPERDAPVADPGGTSLA